ncbi:helix-turn-helix domain-containing protein [Litoreibacter ponti]|nr:AraC family transcriptional regulator [Litoreibacter ponti]
MPSLPIPMIGALVLFFLFLRLWITQGRISPLAILIALCAAQTAIIALAQHYLVPGTRLVQPITATLIPPAAWLAFQITAVRPARRADLLHGLVPVTTLAALLTAPAFLDVLIPGLFVVYGAAILLATMAGPDAQPRAALESGAWPAQIWRIIGIALIASAFSDLLIIAAQAAGAGYLQPWIISLYSVGNLILIGALSLSGHLQSGQDRGDDQQAPSAPPDGALWARVEHYMDAQRPYLDPELTLSKLARRLGVPAKTLSSTINRATGGNVSRYVNTARIEAAQEALRSGETVTGAMLSSGFYTKSNFNREFLRVTGMTPSAWRDAQAPQGL